MKNNVLTQKRLKELLHYNQTTGKFIWKVNKNSAKKGNEAGWLDVSNGIAYRRIELDNRTYRSHRLVCFYMTGGWPENEIDHINHDGLDNKWTNLRSVSHATNTRNARKRIDNKSGITGVFWHKRDKLWIATISDTKKELIRTKDYFEACCTRKSAERKFNYHINHGAVI